jgi:hypothetical protein
MYGVGFGFGVRVSGLNQAEGSLVALPKLQVLGRHLQVPCSAFRVCLSGFAFRPSGSGFRFSGLGCGV